MTRQVDVDSIRLRPATPDDDPAIADLWKRCGLTVSYNDPAADIGFCRASADAELFVATAMDRLIATAMCGHDGHRGWLYYVAVDPDLEGQGIGRRMVRHGEAWLAERGVPKVNLMIRPANRGARDFYRALGYRDTPRHVMGRFLADDTPAETRLKTTITWLEMPARPTHLPSVTVPRGTAFLRAEQPPVSFYRYLYDTVGGPWLWWERRAMGDEELLGHIHDPAVEIYVLYRHGTPAGYVELDRRVGDTINLAYAGLVPDAIGQGLGLALLTWAVETAWAHGPARMTVNTCTLDHPRALAMYQQVGFQPVRQETVDFDDPRLSGLFPVDWPLPRHAHATD